MYYAVRDNLEGFRRALVRVRAKGNYSASDRLRELLFSAGVGVQFSGGVLLYDQDGVDEFWKSEKAIASTCPYIPERLPIRYFILGGEIAGRSMITGSSYRVARTHHRDGTPIRQTSRESL